MTTPSGEVGTLKINMYADERLQADPWAFWDAVRPEHSIVKLDPGSDDGDDVFLALGYDAARDVLQRTDLFSNRWMYLYLPKGPRMLGIEDMDPPVHTAIRRLMNPLFTLAAMQPYQGRIREVARSLLGDLLPNGQCEFMTEFAQKFPAVIILELFGIPREDTAAMLDLTYKMTHPDPVNDPDNSKLLEAVGTINAYIGDLIRERRANPGEDLVSKVVSLLDGYGPEEVTDLHGNILLLLGAGLDTVANSLAAYMVHLSRDEPLRHEFVANPSIIPEAVEELLRLYGIVTAVKVVKDDIDFYGCPMKAGSRVAAATVSANRDEKEFPGATSCNYARDANRHLTFGAGAHRCIGSHLARLELAIALEEWHRLIPEYTIDSTGVKMHSGHMTGYVSLPIRWG